MYLPTFITEPIEYILILPLWKALTDLPKERCILVVEYYIAVFIKISFVTLSDHSHKHILN